MNDENTKTLVVVFNYLYNRLLLASTLYEVNEQLFLREALYYVCFVLFCCALMIIQLSDDISEMKPAKKSAKSNPLTDQNNTTFVIEVKLKTN